MGKNVIVACDFSSKEELENLLDKMKGSAPTFTVFGFVYFFILALIGWVSNKILTFVSNRQKYDVTDVEYDKNIE